MLKFMVVVYRRPELNPAQFRRHLEEVPQWDAIVELYFDNWAAMEVAWNSPQAVASDADLPRFADLSRTSWSAVEEVTTLP